jgi:hypothetical protein
MKQLKHIKLFEAFESIKLGKTLNFINTGAKSIFIDNLKKIASNYDFPISKFNDDMFEYLPFKSALMKNVDPPKPTEREVCKRESDWIPGEFCQGGRVKRTWGAHTRMTECPGCGGTGFKPERKVEPEIQLIKFWFDKDGNFVTVTGCDGQIRNQNASLNKDYSGELYNFSKNLSDYNEVRRISVEELLQLPTGSIVLFNNRGSNPHNGCVSMVYHNKRNNREAAYMLQDEFSGCSPDEDHHMSFDDWHQFAKYSWCVIDGNDFGSAILLEPKVKRVVKKKVEVKPIPEEKAYTWNNLIDLRWMSMNHARDMDSRLKNAHFAIILNLKKMKESDYEKVSSLKALRKQRKEGAFIQPVDVKNANLERYISLLIKKFDANKGLSEIPKILPRALGFTNSITFIIRGINFNNIDNLVSYIYNIIKDPNDSDYYQRNAMSSLEDIYNNFSRRSTQINQNIDSTWKLIDKGTSNKEVDKKISQYFEKYLELGEFIIKKVNSTKIETIYDIEVMMKKFQSIKNFVESTRIQSLRNLRYLSDYLYNSDANSVYSSMEETLDSYPSALNDLDDFRSAIEKILG